MVGAARGTRGARFCTLQHRSRARRARARAAGGARALVVGGIELNNLMKTPKKCTFRGHAPQRRHLHPCFNPRQVADIACFPLLLRAHKKFHFFVPRFSVYSPASSTADQPRFPTLLRRAHDNGSIFTLFFLAAGSRRCAFPTLAARLQESYLLFQFGFVG